MPSVECSVSDFTGTYSHLSAKNTLIVSWPQLIWAAITVGRAGWQDILHDGLFSRFEIVYRVAIIAANLFEGPSGALAKTESYRRLDPSEKAAISYFLGLNLVKVFVGACLDTPWLMHLDVYGKKFDAECPGKSRPDLFGLNTFHDWIVVESKGRTNQCKTSDLIKAKEQSEKLSSIGGKPPVLRFGAVTYFKGENLAFLAIDPPGNNERNPQSELSLERSDFLARYYALVRHFIARASDRHTQTHDGLDFEVCRVPEVNLWIGLRADLLADEPAEYTKTLEIAFAQPGQQQTSYEILGRSTSAQENGDTNQPYIGRDGILVQLGPWWSADNLRMQPGNRS